LKLARENLQRITQMHLFFADIPGQNQPVVRVRLGSLHGLPAGGLRQVQTTARVQGHRVICWLTTNKFRVQSSSISTAGFPAWANLRTSPSAISYKRSKSSSLPLKRRSVCSEHVLQPRIAR